MSGRVIWKFAITAIVFAWSLGSITPLEDTPFEAYVKAEAGANIEEFKALVDRASDQVESGDAISSYAALRTIATAESIDLSQYFPEIFLADIPSLETRNNVLLRELQKRSKGKLQYGLDLVGGVSVTFRLQTAEGESDAVSQTDQLNKAVEILRKRLDGSGVAGHTIRVQGTDRIEIQLPGLNTKDNPDIFDVLTAPAKLEFRLVHRDQVRDIISPFTTPPSQHPAGYEVLTVERFNSTTGQAFEIPYFVKRIPEAKGDIIDEAFATQDPTTGAWMVQLSMTGDGANELFDVTSRIVSEDRRTGVQQPLAIVLDGELYSAPVINEPLSNSAQITGDFSQREAFELANVLNNPLDVPLVPDEIYEVGPTLAKDALENSKQAMTWGAILVVTFMIAYYWIGGVVAVVSGIINVLLVLGVMASFGATLTLPGVAALVLTLGMGVDANILIFERIREEIAEGKSLKAALHSGFDKALSTILDANITTLITAFILIWLGTGPVKGFGITLAIGIFASVIAALIVSRGLLEFLVESSIAKKVLGLPGLPINKLEFLNYRKMAFAGSWILVAVGITFTVMRADKILGVDFRGGDETTISSSIELTTGQIEQLAAEKDFQEVVPVFQTEIGTGLDTIKLQTKEGDGAPFVEVLSAAFPEAEIEVLGVTTIGSTVTGEIQKNAIYSVLAALGGILIYVALRFEFGYGLGAVVATVHDVLMTVGLFVIFGGQFSAPMLAAILMIVGYSINDTIVVFDRIREELGLNPDASLKDVVHLSINRVLSRTIWTSLTTLLAAGTLWIFGAGVIQDFAMIFVFGILTGTFSSIFIATPVFFAYHKGDRNHVEAGETPSAATNGKSPPKSHAAKLNRSTIRRLHRFRRLVFKELQSLRIATNRICDRV